MENNKSFLNLKKFILDLASQVISFHCKSAIIKDRECGGRRQRLKLKVMEHNNIVKPSRNKGLR